MDNEFDRRVAKIAKRATMWFLIRWFLIGYFAIAAYGCIRSSP